MFIVFTAFYLNNIYAQQFLRKYLEVENRHVEIINNNISRSLSNTNFTCIGPGNNVGDITSTCSNHGICQSDGHCYCNFKYATYPKNSETQCNYRRKSRFNAFVLHLFFGLETGAGEWYLGNKDYATFEVVLFFPAIIGFTFVFVLFGCVIDICCDTDGGAINSCGVMGVIIGILSVLAMVGFWGYELWAIATYNRTDGNGVKTW